MSKEVKTTAEAEIKPTEPQTAPVQDFTQEMFDKAIEANSEALQKALDSYIQAEISKRLAGLTPKADTTDNLAVERSEFAKMSYKDRLKLYNTSPEKYKKLTTK